MQLLQKHANYVSQLDNFIHSINGNSEAKISLFQRKEIFIMIISLVIVIVEIMLVLFPTIRKIRKQNIQFRKIAFNQSHIMRQPIVNIKGLIHIIKDTQDITEVKDLLQHLYAETDKLDQIIGDNVSHAQTEDL